MRALLYCAIDEANQFKPVVRSMPSRLATWIKRQSVLSNWALFGRLNFHHSLFMDHDESNVGDIAIRIACAEFVKAKFGPATQISFVQWKDLRPESVDHINANFDLFVIAGSGYLFLDSQGNLSPRLAADIAILERLTCRKVALSVGANQVLVGGVEAGGRVSSTAAAQLRQLVHTLDAISVRCGTSRDIVQQAVGRPITVTADPVLFLPDFGALPNGPIDPAGAPAVGLNLALHGPSSAMMLQTSLKPFCEAILQHQKEAGCRYFYFMHSDAERVIPQLLRGRGVEVTVVAGQPRELLAGYRQLSYHLCQMLHSSIFAMSVGCPVVNLAYDIKNYAFFRLMGVEQHCLPVTTFETAPLLAKLNELRANRAAMQARIMQRRAELRAEIDLYMDQVAAVVGLASEPA